ncbi:MAG: glycosyltransferase family 4 protein [Salinivenus sp.]
MRIALFHSTLPSPTRKVGGVEVVVHQLANHLVQAGHAVTVFSLTPQPDDALYEHEHLFPGWPSLLSRPLLRLFVLPALLNRVSFRDFDVVHFHGDDWFYLRRSVPSVRTVHGSALEEARSAESWKRTLMQHLLYPLEHLSVRLATVGLAIGPKTATLYPSTVLANNGVDLERFQPGPKTPAPSILFVGTWTGRKRGRVLFDIFRREVLPSVPNATLVMVSDHVSDACADHPSVEYWARPSDAELAALYRQAWVFAFPSTYEGFGLPYIEAMASGTAVLSSPNDGARHVLADGTYGEIVEDADFGTALIDLLRSSDRRKALETGGLERAQTFAWPAVVSAHEAHYAAALTGEPVASPSSPSPDGSHEAARV